MCGEFIHANCFAVHAYGTASWAALCKMGEKEVRQAQRRDLNSERGIVQRRP